MIRLIFIYISAKRFLGYLRVLIHYLFNAFRELCSSLHQGEEQPDTYKYTRGSLKSLYILFFIIYIYINSY